MSIVDRREIKDRFEACPACGYENGFHMILVNDSPVQTAAIKLQLKCPSCKQIYDLNLYCTIKR